MAREYVEERGGGKYMAGTRVSLDSIVECFRGGMSAESILDEFDTLTLAQIYGAIAFYLDNQAAVDAYLLRQKKRFEAMRRNSPAIPVSLRNRLANARDEMHSGHSE